MATEFLDHHPTGSRPRVVPMLISGLLGFLLGSASLFAPMPMTGSAQKAYPLAPPSVEPSNLERGRQADAARLEGLADRWLSQGCGHSGVGSADRWW
jgi:hypothetical protein